MENNPFKILGIQPTDDKNAIRQAYLKQIKKYHPDIFDGDKVFAKNMCEKINAAYQKLNDENFIKKFLPKKEFKSKVEKINKTEKKIRIKEHKLKKFFEKRYSGENKGKLAIDIMLAMLIALLIIVLLS